MISIREEVLIEQFFDPFDLFGRLIRQQIEPDPAVAVFGHPSECRTALAPEPNRHALFTDRPGIAQHVGEIGDSP
jgi:hypothetical protein